MYFSKCWAHGTVKAMAAMTDPHGAAPYSRVEIAATGHINWISGKNAACDVYPQIFGTCSPLRIYGFQADTVDPTAVSSRDTQSIS